MPTATRRKPIFDPEQDEDMDLYDREDEEMDSQLGSAEPPGQTLGAAGSPRQPRNWWALQQLREALGRETRMPKQRPDLGMGAYEDEAGAVQKPGLGSKIVGLAGTFLSGAGGGLSGAGRYAREFFDTPFERSRERAGEAQKMEGQRRDDLLKAAEEERRVETEESLGAVREDRRKLLGAQTLAASQPKPPTKIGPRTKDGRNVEVYRKDVNDPASEIEIDMGPVPAEKKDLSISEVELAQAAAKGDKDAAAALKFLENHRAGIARASRAPEKTEDPVLSASDAILLGVPYGTTRSQAAALGRVPQRPIPESAKQVIAKADAVDKQLAALEAAHNKNPNMVGDIWSGGKGTIRGRFKEKTNLISGDEALFRNRVMQTLNREVNNLSGAAVSVQEMERLKNSLPSLGMGAAAFSAALKVSREIIRDIKNARQNPTSETPTPTPTGSGGAKITKIERVQ